jgi:glycosyltransferase involved in cell wall biosynthesis
MKQLRILMLTKYFYPHPRGGSEQSSYHLAQMLIKQGHKVFFKFSFRQHPDIIHVQSPSFLPVAVMIGKLFNIPIVLTVRDYSLICPLGFCLWEKTKACSLREFISVDIPTYARFYPSNVLSPLLHLGIRLRSKFWRYFAHHVNQIVCISQAQKKIFTANGFSSLQVIYNTTDFFPVTHKNRANKIMFVGRLTPGKGADLLIPLAQKYQIIVVGTGFLEPKLRHSSAILMGQISYSQVIKLYRQVKLAIFPSVWPEPFGRGALEAIAAGTPVVTSNRGGLPEIVQHKYGLSVEPTPAKLTQAIDYVINHHRQFTSRIAADRKKLIFQFNLNPTNQYEKLYYSCLS